LEIHDITGKHNSLQHVLKEVTSCASELHFMVAEISMFLYVLFLFSRRTVAPTTEDRWTFG
jgi:hypothetical protein